MELENIENKKVHKRAFVSKNKKWLVTVTTILDFEKHVHSFGYEQELDYRDDGIISNCMHCDAPITEVV